MGLKPSYLKNIMMELRTFFRFHKESLDRLPEFRPIPIQPPAIKWLTKEEQDKVFEYLPKHHIPIFTFLRYYPVRPNEACGLLKSKIMQNAPIPYFIIDQVVTRQEVVKEFTKTRLPKVLPIIPELSWIFEGNGNAYLFQRKNGKPYTNAALWAIWKEANRKSGVKRVSMYQGLKHSRGWQLIENGATMDEVSQAMGHTTTKHTRRYAGYTLRKMLDVLKPYITPETPKLLTYKTFKMEGQCGPYGRDLLHPKRPRPYAGRG
jgi:integrase